MAKVIKSGTPWHKEVKCSGLGNSSIGCGSIILVTQYDIYKTASYSFGELEKTFKTFICPECGEETDITVKIDPLGQRPSLLEMVKIKEQWKEKVLRWKEQKMQNREKS